MVSPSDSEASTLDTHFVECSDDAETLWEVEEIVGEKANYYRVRWAGLDDNGDPWPLDWVPKQDCTDPLVRTWKRKKADKAKQNRRRKSSSGRKSIQLRVSTASTSTVSAASSSTVKHTTTTTPKKKKTGTAVAAGNKRKLHERDQESTSVVEPPSRVGPPRKKRKLVDGQEPTKPAQIQRGDKQERGRNNKRHPEKATTRNTRVRADDLGSDDEPPPPPKNGRLKEPPRSASAKGRGSKPRGSPLLLSSSSDTSTATPKKNRSKTVSEDLAPAHNNNDEDSALEYTDSHSKRQEQDQDQDHRSSSTPSSNSKSPSPTRSLSLPVDVFADNKNTSKGKGKGKDKGKARQLEVVPETESEESQEQRRIREHVEENAVRTPLKNSVVSKMKPRTPGFKRHFTDPDIIASPLPSSPRPSRPGTPPSQIRIRSEKVREEEKVEEKKNKLLGPIPRMSPSTFASLPVSANVGEGDESSIEEFDSPDKKKRRDDTISQITDPSNVSLSVPVPPLSSVMTDAVVTDVVAVTADKRMDDTQASVVVEEEESEQDADGETAPSTLEELADSFVDYDGGMGNDDEFAVAESSRTQNTNERDVVTTAMKAVQKVYLLRQEEEEDTQDLLAELGQQRRGKDEVLVVPESSGIKKTNDEVVVVTTEAYKAQFLRQEEEESTQDLLAELERQRQQQQSGFGTDASVDSQASGGLSVSGEVENVIDSLEVAPKSSAPFLGTFEDSMQPPSSSRPHTPIRALGGSFVPATSSPARSELVSTFVQPLNDVQTLDPAMTLSKEKPEETTRLDDVSTVSQSLPMEDIDQPTEETPEVAGLVKENQALRELLQVTQGRLTFIEKNAEVFRDQYLRVSSLMPNLRRTNAELEERVEVAESQAKSGLAGVRAMFELRIKVLEEEMVYHKRVSSFLIEQAQRTQEEDIRRRAAEHPELEMRCGELEERYAELEGLLDGARGMIDTFEKQVTARDRENEVLKAEKGRMEAENRERMERLRLELEESRREVEELRREREVVNGNGSERVVELPPAKDDDVVETTGGEQGKATAEVEVYRCQWKTHGTGRCDAIFLTREALERHVEFGGHIQ